MEKIFYPNMDLVRYVLAFGVLIAHFNELGGHDIPFFISSFDCVGGFFALSGFLMYPSYCKARSARKYVSHRARRILPSYFFIVLLCAFGGVFLTSLPVGEYFLNPDFLKYLAANLSFLNWLHPSLPGVFEGEEFVTNAVDGSLWTMKVEWCLYFSVPLFVWLACRLRKVRKEYLCMAVMAISILYRILFLELYSATGREIFNILSRQVFGQLSYFYMGMLIFFVRDRIAARLPYVIAISVALFLVVPYVDMGNIIISPVAVPMLFLSISMIGMSPKFLQHKNNISYNIYLIHYPVIQLSVGLGINRIAGPWPLLFVVGLTLALSIASILLTDRWLGFSRTRRKQ